MKLLKQSLRMRISTRNHMNAKYGRRRGLLTLSNTRLAAFLQLMEHDFGIYGFLKRSSV